MVRTLQAPREMVWKAWTVPERVKQWWGPRGFTCPVCQMDLRLGGRYLNCLRSPGGHDYWSAGAYLEIVPMERLEYIDSFSDPGGNVVPASRYGIMGDLPLEMRVRATFEDREGATVMRVEHIGLPEGEQTEAARQGWGQSFDKLEELLETSKVKVPRYVFMAEPGQQEVQFARVYDAPRDLVFKAYTDPELIPRWWGPARFKTSIDILEPRQGGRWRFVQRDAQNTAYVFHGVFHAFEPPGLLIQTFEFEGMPGHAELQTALLEEIDGGTRFRATVVYQSVMDRDAEMGAGMEDGMKEGMDRLDGLLMSMRST